jgi:tetratricopeptide (TPR) repeat protein
MSDGREIRDEADAAMRMTLTNRVAGENEFQRLLKTHPNDGMIYFKRGEAYEALGKRGLAAADYRKAEGLLPLEEWKARARQALARVTT